MIKNYLHGLFVHNISIPVHSFLSTLPSMCINITLVKVKVVHILEVDDRKEIRENNKDIILIKLLSVTF